jgi:hypothetical protein
MARAKAEKGAWAVTIRMTTRCTGTGQSPQLLSPDVGERGFAGPAVPQRDGGGVSAAGEAM